MRKVIQMTIVKEFVSLEDEIHIINMQRWITIVFLVCVTVQALLIICDYVFNYWMYLII